MVEGPVYTNAHVANDEADELTVTERNAKGVGKRKFEFDQVPFLSSTFAH